MAKHSFNELWSGEINGKEYSHSRVYKISGDQFYALLSGQEDAFFQLYQVLPRAIADFLSSASGDTRRATSSAVEEITKQAKQNQRDILDQMTLDNFGYYLGFKDM